MFSFALLQIALPQVVERLRTDLPSVMIGSVLLAIGLGGLAVYALGTRQRDRALLWFGIFGVIYAIRTLLDTAIIQLAAAIPGRTAQFLISGITYCIGLPLLPMLAEIFPEWRKTLRTLTWFLSAFALAGIASDFIQKQPRSLDRVNSVIVLFAFTAFLIAVFRRRNAGQDVKLLQFALVIYTLTVFAANVRPLFGWRFLGVEPIGLLLLLLSLGQVLTRRIYRTNERLVELDKEMQVARRIQQSILPAEPPGGTYWDIAAKYTPMTAVAGDFYDFLVVDAKRLGVLIADVSGHGVPAALIASMVKIAVASQRAHAESPAKVLAGINQSLCGNSQGQYVTAAYLYLDLELRLARYAAAAHPAMFLQRQAGEIAEITHNGLMLGLFPHATYSECDFPLMAGDRFLLYTDGLPEAQNPAGEFFGTEPLKRCLSEASSQSSQRLVDLLTQRVSNWAKTAQDDLTLIAIGWRS